MGVWTGKVSRGAKSPTDAPGTDLVHLMANRRHGLGHWESQAGNVIGQLA
jgi:hypothetical protein